MFFLTSWVEKSRAECLILLNSRWSASNAVSFLPYSHMKVTGWTGSHSHKGISVLVFLSLDMYVICVCVCVCVAVRQSAGFVRKLQWRQQWKLKGYGTNTKKQTQVRSVQTVKLFFVTRLLVRDRLLFWVKLTCSFPVAESSSPSLPTVWRWWPPQRYR